MIITHEQKIIMNGTADYYEMSGLSTDDKPLDVAESSLFLEVDTGDVYYFDGSTWAKMGS